MLEEGLVVADHDIHAEVAAGFRRDQRHRQAAGVFQPAFGIALSPILSGLAMAFSSVSVVANALRLRSFRFSDYEAAKF